jgi:hypothetical protein
MSTGSSSNDFNVSIVTGYDACEKIYKEGYTYYALPHNTKYKLELSNNKSVRCDAHVSIDGRKVGTWRIESRGIIEIERPVDERKQFVFLKTDSHDGQVAGLYERDPSNGIIKVVFKPERQMMLKSSHLRRCVDTNFGLCPMAAAAGPTPYHMTEMGRCMPESYASKSLSEGGTGLVGHSHQDFSSTSALRNIDHSNVTEISLRLVVDDGRSESSHAAICMCGGRCIECRRRSIGTSGWDSSS